MTQSTTRDKIESLLKSYDEDEEISTELDESRLKEIHVLLNNNGVTRSINILENSVNNIKFDYANLVELEDNLKSSTEKISKIREDIEVEKLHTSGEIYDWKKIRKIFEKRKVFKNFPKFKWKVFKELVKHPPTRIKNYKDEDVVIDSFLARKLIIGIIQMIGNRMDLWIMNTGGEGSGKSCFGSQQVLFLYYFLHEVGLVEYDYDLKKIIKGSLKDLLDYLAEQPINDFFNISELDEAEDLDRMNYREDDNKKFKSTMRRSRKNLNIIVLNTPQIGEIDTSVTLARINIIFSCQMDYEPTTGLLNKGFAKMFIIPRTNKTFSPFFRKNLTREHIKSAFSKQFEKKIDYYKDLPNEILIKDIHFYETWGFDEEEYDAHIKKENKTKHFDSGIRLTKDQMYIIHRYGPSLKDWYDKLEKEFITVGSKDYHVLRKLIQRINYVFNNDEKLLKRMENIRRYRG